MDNVIPTIPRKDGECFGKFNKDDCYCKECCTAVECYEWTTNVVRM